MPKGKLKNTLIIIGLSLYFVIPSSADAAEKGSIQLNDGGALQIRDQGFIQVFYTDEAYGLLVEKDVNLQQSDGETVTRQLTKNDLREACRTVLGWPQSRIGSHPPDYVFFQTVKRVVDASIVKLRRTEKVYFETRGNRCREVEEPQEVK